MRANESQMRAAGALISYRFGVSVFGFRALLLLFIIMRAMRVLYTHCMYVYSHVHDHIRICSWEPALI